ncbi:hypothetical protein [Phaeobacter inhibens]|uniref:hypothetical protein n=1 Tax=Phaeobacter inhibens TaxID=221822 RepID=UPI0021A44747|nr:hypothetical protein [Phaeobacter inhibens]UWR89014.1 hypothetical protein K4L01_02460 [Phaeobacter inhibens]
MAATRSQQDQDLEVLSSKLRTLALQARNIRDALLFARLYGRLHWDNISGFFGDDELERELLRLWQDELVPRGVNNLPAIEPGHWCHIATRIYPAGGHTRLLHALADGAQGRVSRQSLLLTQRSERSAIEKLPKALDVVEELSGAPEQVARVLCDKAARAEVILLHNHPDDIGAALAARCLRAAGRRVLFVNHADHVFSFGPGSADVVLEICATGWRTTEHRRTAHAQQFMGIPAVRSDYRVTNTDRDRSGSILSIGGPGKFTPVGALSFPDFLEQILPLVPNNVMLIGPSERDPWWKPVLQKFPGRIELCGVLPAEKLQAAFARSACYVDSFPLDGGSVFPEAVMAGLPAFALNRGAAPGVSPTDALRVPDMSTMVRDLAGFLNGADYPYDIETVRKEIVALLSVEAVAARVDKAAKGEIIPPPESLMRLGNRSADYNAERWRAAEKVHIPKRIWRGLRFATRLKLSREMKALPLSAAVISQLKTRILLG